MKRNQILITPKDLIEFMEAEEYSRFIEKTVERMVKSPDNDLTRKIAKDIDFSLWIIAKWEKREAAEWTGLRKNKKKKDSG